MPTIDQAKLDRLRRLAAHLGHSLVISFSARVGEKDRYQINQFSANTPDELIVNVERDLKVGLNNHAVESSRLRSILNLPRLYSDADVRLLVGYLSAQLTELRGTEAPRLIELAQEWSEGLAERELEAARQKDEREPAERELPGEEP